MSWSRVSTSSLTPASSTVWPISGMPASARRASAARVARAEFAGVIAMHAEPQRGAPGPERRHQFAGHPFGIDDRHAAVDADHADVPDGVEVG